MVNLKVKVDIGFSSFVGVFSIAAVGGVFISVVGVVFSVGFVVFVFGV